MDKEEKNSPEQYFRDFIETLDVDELLSGNDNDARDGLFGFIDKLIESNNLERNDEIVSLFVSMVKWVSNTEPALPSTLLDYLSAYLDNARNNGYHHSTIEMLAFGLGMAYERKAPLEDVFEEDWPEA